MSQSANLTTEQPSLVQPVPEEQPPKLQRPAKLLNWNFILLWQGQVVSGLGAQFYGIAMILWIKQATESATLLGGINTLTGVTSVLLGIFAGTLADRYSRRNIIIVSDLIRGLLMLVLTGMFFFTPQSTGMIVLWMAATAVCMSVASSFFSPAIGAALPELVPEDQLTRANSLTSSSSQITRFLGQALGGLLFRTLGAPLITLINGVTYIFSAITEMFIEIPQNIPEKSGNWRQEVSVFKDDLVEGFYYVWQNGGLKTLALAGAALSFLTAPVMLLFPFYIEDFIGVAIDWYGYLLAVFGSGVLAGSLGAGLVKISGRARMITLIVLAFFNSVVIALFGITSDIYSAMGLAFFVGAAIGFNSVHVNAILQMTIPSEIRGRAFGFMSTLAGSITPLGMGLGGLVFDWTGQNIPLIYIGCGIMQVLVVVIIALNRNYREFVSYEPVAEHT